MIIIIFVTFYSQQQYEKGLLRGVCKRMKKLLLNRYIKN